MSQLEMYNQKAANQKIGVMNPASTTFSVVANVDMTAKYLQVINIGHSIWGGKCYTKVYENFIGLGSSCTTRQIWLVASS